MSDMPERQTEGAPKVTALDIIKSQREQFLKVIPRHLRPERLLRIAEGAIKRNRQLLACSAASLLRAVMEASALGLEPGILGEGWLIPFGKEAQFIIGYQGFIKLATQSKAVIDVNVGVVRKNDEFDYELGSEPFLKHRLSLDADPSERPYAAYCVITTIGGGKQITVLGVKEIEKIRAVSRAANNGPWVQWWDAMAIKTAIKRALKNVAKTPELSRAMEFDERVDVGQSTVDLFEATEVPELEEKPAEVKQGTAEQLIEIVTKKGK